MVDRIDWLVDIAKFGLSDLLKLALHNFELFDYIIAHYSNSFDKTTSFAPKHLVLFTDEYIKLIKYNDLYKTGFIYIRFNPAKISGIPLFN